MQNQGYPQQPQQNPQQPPQYQQAPQCQQPPQYQQAPQYQAPPQYQQPPKQYDPRFDPQDIEGTKYINILSYLSILFLIPMFMYKESKFTKFHVNQGIVLCIFSVGGSILFGIIGAAVGALTSFVPVVGIIVSLIVSLISLAYNIVILVFTIIGIVNTCTGKAKELPLIGKIKIYK